MFEQQLAFNERKPRHLASARSLGLLVDVQVDVFAIIVLPSKFDGEEMAEGMIAKDHRVGPYLEAFRKGYLFPFLVWFRG